MARWGERAAALIVLALGTWACPPFPEIASYRCESDFDCVTPQVCSVGGSKVCCTPKTCPAFGDQCDTLPDDGCGHPIFCGCPDPMTTCIGGHCRCPQDECTVLNCGSHVPDGCGEFLDCSDTCGAPTVCDETTRTCECKQFGSCVAAGATCGTIPISCDNVSTAFCGTCPCGMACGPDNRCQLDDPICGNDVSCGFICTTDAPSAPPDPWCGSCGAGNACDLATRTCVPRAPQLCWGPLVAFPDVDSRNHRFFPVEERGGVWLYDSTELLDRNDDACTRHARIELTGQTRLSTRAYERIESSAFPVGTGCPPTGAPCFGSALSQFVRPDAREMFFVATYPCNDPAKLYLSFRGDDRARWSPPVGLAGTAGGASVPSYPLLMPDNKTLIYARNRPAMFAAVRSTTVAGDPSFVERVAPVDLIDTADMLPGETLFEINAMSISCDRRALIYERSFNGTPQRWDIRMADIVDASGPTFARPRAHSPYEKSTSEFHIQRVVESPDCSELFLRTRERQYVAQRVACP